MGLLALASAPVGDWVFNCQRKVFQRGGNSIHNREELVLRGGGCTEVDMTDVIVLAEREERAGFVVLRVRPAVHRNR